MIQFKYQTKMEFKKHWDSLVEFYQNNVQPQFKWGWANDKRWFKNFIHYTRYWKPIIKYQEKLLEKYILYMRKLKLCHIHYIDTVDWTGKKEKLKVKKELEEAEWIRDKISGSLFYSLKKRYILFLELLDYIPHLIVRIQRLTTDYDGVKIDIPNDLIMIEEAKMYADYRFY